LEARGDAHVEDAANRLGHLRLAELDAAGEAVLHGFR
jgi:hypothetical protein